MLCDPCGSSLQYHPFNINIKDSDCLFSRLFCKNITCFRLARKDYIYSQHQLTVLEKAHRCFPQLCWCLKYRSEAIHLSQFPIISWIHNNWSQSTKQLWCHVSLTMVIMIPPCSVCQAGISNTQIKEPHKSTYQSHLPWISVGIDDSELYLIKCNNRK